jgi:hypothetical protein
MDDSDGLGGNRPGRWRPGQRGVENAARRFIVRHHFIFAAFDDRELGELTDKLAALQDRLEKACMKVVLDI